MRQALRGGIVHYLLKPFSHDDLRDSLLHYEQSYRRLDAEDTAEQQDVNRVFRRPAGPVTDARLPKKLSPETADLIEQALRGPPAVTCPRPSAPRRSASPGSASAATSSTS